jgi:predicted DNA-binding transcriptional regulator YafY
MAYEIERKFALLDLLASTREPLTREEIYAKLPTFYSLKDRKPDSLKKMFERDKEELTGEGFVVAAVADMFGVERYSLTPRAPWLKDFQLSGSQAHALREALDDPAISGQMMGQGLVALRKLLAFSAPFDEKLQGEKAPDPQENAMILKVHEALLAKKVLEVNYPGHRGIDERRFFSPYALFYRFGRPYLVAGCHKDHFPKVVALLKVTRLRFSKQPFQPLPADFSVVKYIQSGQYDYRSDKGTTVRVRVSADEAWLIRERHYRRIVSEAGDGSVECEFFVTNPTQFFGFLLTFGAGAELLSPPAIRQQFKLFLEKAAP